MQSTNMTYSISVMNIISQLTVILRASNYNEYVSQFQSWQYMYLQSCPLIQNSKLMAV